MEGAGDIVAVSLPFAAGVMVAAATGPSTAVASAAGICAGAMIAAAVLMKRRSTIPILAAFFFSGVLCWCTHGLAGLPEFNPAEVFPAARNALDRLMEDIDKIPFPHNSTNALAKALLTGRRQDLDRETIAAFRQSGASHILALSGLHLGVIYGILLKVLSVLGNSIAGRIAKSVTTVSACGFYAVMTGAGPSITRAFLFIVLNELARHAPGRRRTSLDVFCTALTVQLAFQPAVITSVGFQLSYLAMLGIFLIHPRLEAWYPLSGSRKLNSFDPMRKIWTSASLTLSCQLFTAPLVWARFHTFPNYFLLTNLLAMPVSEAFMLCTISCLFTENVELDLPLLTTLTDRIAESLQFCLEVISGM